ncbi:hypothetical protein [Pseudoalteromonas rubra]|uniref:hypothetical protein n=1 Tax=Pseudoalteromonas rubra TaxID=43658 RepID=UPI002DBC2075|nr:hypothetical protein [Pseudoalteromonas rubra]MEC4091607.1 hypothetical protein [Pseudoalteromonas rubra]
MSEIKFETLVPGLIEVVEIEPGSYVHRTSGDTWRYRPKSASADDEGVLFIATTKPSYHDKIMRCISTGRLFHMPKSIAEIVQQEATQSLEQRVAAMEVSIATQETAITAMLLTDGTVEYFEYGHLPQHLQEVSKPIGELAIAMRNRFPNCPEAAVGIRKLLEAKDCLVRAAVTQHRAKEQDK